MRNIEICYVCEKGIRGGKVVIGSLARHEKCEPGSKNWLASKVGRDSGLRKYFEQKEAKCSGVGAG